MNKSFARGPICQWECPFLWALNLSFYCERGLWTLFVHLDLCVWILSSGVSTYSQRAFLWLLQVNRRESIESGKGGSGSGGSGSAERRRIHNLRRSRSWDPANTFTWITMGLSFSPEPPLALSSKSITFRVFKVAAVPQVKCFCEMASTLPFCTPRMEGQLHQHHLKDNGMTFRTSHGKRLLGFNCLAIQSDLTLWHGAPSCIEELANGKLSQSSIASPNQHPRMSPF